MSAEHPCEGCYHWRGENYNGKSCNYIFDVGRSRPCPPGAECTVKRVVKSKDRRKRCTPGKGLPF
jgi:hypothetical protein